MENISQNLLWDAILDLRNKVLLSQNPVKEYSLVFGNGTCRVHQGIVDGNAEQKVIVISHKPGLFFTTDSFFFTLGNNNNITQQGDSFLEPWQHNFLKQYLPFCFSREIAQKLNRTYAVLHLAQSIDGRIATETGHSKWIGSRENLIHAHRMRAICDAILIGHNTLKCDSPMLNVRHVAGPNPIKVIIANTRCNLDDLRKNEGKILLFTSIKMDSIEGVEIITLPESSGFILSNLILEELYNRKIYSLFIEGGAITASHFIENNAVDKVQLFISPQIFGSGINSFTLPPIDQVEDSRSFLNPAFYPMGNGILFEGELFIRNPDEPKTEKIFLKQSKSIC
jgi:diaminohydroxyphosphoribosylaminopyrimidine deaminase/5-amino-6-(5-phosphoribosylamino)uracil reductase